MILISKDTTSLVLAKGIKHKGVALPANQVKLVESSLFSERGDDCIENRQANWDSQKGEGSPKDL